MGIRVYYFPRVIGLNKSVKKPISLYRDNRLGLAHGDKILSLQGRRVNWLAYFSLYNIELEILINAFATIYNEMRACTIKDLTTPHVFEKLNPSLVDKLVGKGVLKKFRKSGNTYYTLTSRGLKAFFITVSPIVRVINNNEGKTLQEIAGEVSKHVLFGGIHRVYKTHQGLVKRILDILVTVNLLHFRDGLYYPVSEEERAKAVAEMLSRISGVATLRRIEDIVRTIVQSIGIDQSRIDEIIANIVSHGIVIGDRDPRRALLELLLKVRNLAAEKLRNGRVLEAAAYEAAGLEIIRSLERLGVENKELRENKSKFLFHFYEALGDYFYQNLAFDAARTIYHWAVLAAQDTPALARDAHRANAKYLLSHARSLASKGRYEEALARLDELIGYYKSTGALREAHIAEALRKEYMAEIEIKRNKPCHASRSWLEAASIFDNLGGEYKSKAQALRVKSLISRAECIMFNEKKIEEAVKLLEQASRDADEILSPHLKNVAKSMLHEAKASLAVSKGDLLLASKEYAEAARYYDLREYTPRALLNYARSYKFRAYHKITNGMIDEPLSDLGKSVEKYLELIRLLNERLRSGRSVDYYLLKEGIKGYLDSVALISIIQALKLMASSPIPNKYILSMISEKLYTTLSSLVDAGRWTEYGFVLEAYRLVKEFHRSNNVDELVNILGELALILDTLSIKARELESPRARVIMYSLLRLLANMKSSLEVITRYVEELGSK